MTLLRKKTHQNVEPCPQCDNRLSPTTNLVHRKFINLQESFVDTIYIFYFKLIFNQPITSFTHTAAYQGRMIGTIIILCRLLFSTYHQVMKAHFYWPNMYNFVKNCVDKCNECVNLAGVVVGGFTKAVVVPSYEPDTPMEFLTIDFVRHLL